MNLAGPHKLQLARQLIKTKRHAEGLSLYAELFKESAQFGGEYGRAAVHCGDFELASQVWEKVRRLDPRNCSYIFWLAGEYAKIGLNGKARILLSRVVKLESRNLGARIKLAWLLSRTSGVEEAREALDECLALDAHYPPALYLRAHLDARENKMADAERQLRDLLAAGVSGRNVRYSCHAELARILERTERHDEAMAQLALAKDEWRCDVEPQASTAMFERRHNEIREAKSLPKNILQTWAKAFPSDEVASVPAIAFLTGSARSGTTLLERILDANPAIAACDESFVFHRIKEFIGVGATEIPLEELKGWRERYMKSLTLEMNLSGKEKVLLDKNPSQTFWLPAILRLFPGLRVLIALRDPRDILMSLYFQDQPYTNPLTLEQLAQHYSDVMDLWLIVREWEGLAWLETRYEDIVVDLEKEGRRVTEFLGVEWSEAQARYHE
ncbi:MAG TPA: sulfotransferase, partial [Verrucomicrobiae bacterium]|nr:sulfotransferase [Verrucomicrobiae bacterium]